MLNSIKIHIWVKIKINTPGSGDHKSNSKNEIENYYYLILNSSLSKLNNSILIKSDIDINLIFFRFEVESKIEKYEVKITEVVICKH